MKTAVVLFNLGGPFEPAEIELFLRRLFSDPAILGLPGLFRIPLAAAIAKWRFFEAKKNYDRIGGRSPILAQTQAQAQALQLILGKNARVFVAMRYAAPSIRDVVRQVKDFGSDFVTLLPLYPQYSLTTTASAFSEWRVQAKRENLKVLTQTIDAYPQLDGFIDALADMTRGVLEKKKAGVSYRFLLSAHGLPESIVARGDPYPNHIKKTAAALAVRLGLKDFVVCFQSRVGPMKWLKPSAETEICRAGAEGKGVVMIPISFVSEHSETLVELDYQYALLAKSCGVADYLRVPCVGTHQAFICALASLVLNRESDVSIIPDETQP